jgi:hypothetical protein
MVSPSCVYLVHSLTRNAAQPLKNPRVTLADQTIPRVKIGTRSSVKRSVTTASSRKRTGMIRARMSARAERRMASGNSSDIVVNDRSMVIQFLLREPFSS